MPYRNAASVFPEPVGAWISVWPPAAIAGQPSAWAGVGPANVRSNQERVGFGEDVERIGHAVIVPRRTCVRKALFGTWPRIESRRTRD